MGRVLLADPIDARAEAWLRDRCEVVRPGSGDSLALTVLIAGCEALIVRTTAVDAELIAAGRRLRVIAKHGSGTDNIDLAAASEHGVVVTNTPGANAPAVAEFTLICLLLVSRPVVAGHLWLRQAPEQRPLVVAAQRAGLVGRELSGQTVGVVGWGQIGRRVGEACGLLGAQVVAYDPALSSSGLKQLDALSVADSLEALLKSADIVTLHVPLTAETNRLIGRAELAHMRRGSALVNTARGGLLDESALADALETGHLRAAALDVFATEPPGNDNRLLGLPNVVATPHIAGITDESLLRMGLSSAQAVVDVLSGRAPQHAVNRSEPTVSGDLTSH